MNLTLNNKKIQLILVILNTLNIIVINLYFNYIAFIFVNYLVAGLGVGSLIAYIIYQPSYQFSIRILGIINGIVYILLFLLAAVFSLGNTFGIILCITIALLILLLSILLNIWTDFYSVQLLLIMAYMVIVKTLKVIRPNEIFYGAKDLILYIILVVLFFISLPYLIYLYIRNTKIKKVN